MKKLLFILILCCLYLNPIEIESPTNDFTRYCQKRNMEISIADYVRYRFNNAYISSNNQKEKIQ